MSLHSLRLLLGEGLRLSLFGAVLGALLSLAAAPLMSSLLFTITATDPWTFASVSIGILFVCLAACVIPALRAAAVDPVRALQND